MEPAEYATLFAQEERFWWYRGLRRLVEDHVSELPLGGSAGAPSRILDAGCGTGGMLVRLAERGRVTGLDWSPIALQFARRRGVFPLTRGSVERLPFRSGCLDLIVSLDVLYHRGVASDLDALQEFRRCLRPGGTLVLNLPAFESLRSSHDQAIHTARRYRRETLRRLLDEAGFATRRVTYWNTILFPALAVVRRMRRTPVDSAESGVGGGVPLSDVRPVSGPLDAALGCILALERRWLRFSDLPFGLSLLAVAQRPAERR